MVQDSINSKIGIETKNLVMLKKMKLLNLKRLVNKMMIMKVGQNGIMEKIFEIDSVERANLEEY